MSLNEYFGDWLNVIDEPELLKVVSIINTIPKEVLAPCYNDIFKAFTMCTLKDCRVVFLGQDPLSTKRYCYRNTIWQSQGYQGFVPIS